MKKVCFLYWVLVLVCAHASAMDFTPVRSENSQGFLRAILVDGSTRYVANLAPGTSMTGGSAKAVFLLSEPQGASFSLGKSPLTPEVPFSEEGIGKYRAAALALIAASAAKVTIVKEEPDAFTANGWANYRFTLSFVLPGRRFVQQVAFVNFSAKEQWVLVTVSPEKDIAVAQDRCMAFFGSLHPLGQREDLAAPVFP